MTIKLKQLIGCSTVEIKYIDSEGYTIPMPFTEKLFKSVTNDFSVEKLKFTDSNGLVFEVKPNNT